ncbi:OmpA family protein [Phenylobacterium sp.]|uniref:OmpA family protein n=1 Tax=Phenylobacterium sp. TaxID=1871053 RepID=UPI00272F62E1|nr:OmpA family protein [Phenylobacterium sp.]MDP2215017.1 OmpA family protein [Phenylobacterium sp.]
MIRPSAQAAWGLGLLVLTACGAPPEQRQDVADAPPPDPAIAAPPVAAAPAASPLGSGAGLAGSVGGLTGAVTAFKVQETATAFIVELAADVLFDFDSADLSPQAPEQLRRAAALVAPGQTAIQVIGHTDSVGEADYNLALSLRRARAVADWLSQAGGVPSSRLAASGRGESEPVAPNETASGADDPQGRALNRRVVVVIPKPPG